MKLFSVIEAMASGLVFSCHSQQEITVTKTPDMNKTKLKDITALMKEASPQALQRIKDYLENIAAITQGGSTTSVAVSSLQLAVAAQTAPAAKAVKTKTSRKARKTAVKPQAVTVMAKNKVLLAKPSRARQRRLETRVSLTQRPALRERTATRRKAALEALKPVYRGTKVVGYCR